MKKQTKTVNYQQQIFGTWGKFNSPSGPVEFVETKARISTESPDPESRLTAFLRPVREALPTERMDFNQLLQRDLDDHRVATELVPYILEKSNTGPAFFPPIVTALLPFNGSDPQPSFPSKNKIAPHEDEIAFWSGYEHEGSFKFEKALNGDTDEENLHISKSARLSWNDEKAKLIVLDGQHRAMALLSIFRTINDKWDGQSEKYKHFYEPIVKKHLEKFGKSEASSIFSNIELPVTIIWFPNLSQDENQHLAARKLFVDVNKNARPPSESRVLLLSDERLSPILMRRVLNELRVESETLPIYAVEYDHPERDQTASRKWSAISNVTVLQDCVWRAVFGPDRYISDVQSNFRGRDGFAEPAQFMRRSLNIDSIFPKVISAEEGTYDRNELSDYQFPRSELPKIEEQFMASYGYLIVQMLSRLDPYVAHGNALKELRKNWSGSDSVSRLAKDAVFEGVGMYWTLRDGFLHWKEEKRLLKEEELEESDVVRAWKETHNRQQEFENVRSRHFLNSKKDESVKTSKECFSVYSTYACQLGFILCARTLIYKSNVSFEQIPNFIDALIRGANNSLATPITAEHSRKVFVSKDIKNPINLLSKLDSPLAVYFRYLWLEVLCCSESFIELQDFIGWEQMDSLRLKGRTHYFRKIKHDRRADLRRTNPEWSNEQIENQAEKTAKKHLSAGLKKWFSVDPNDFDNWYSSSPAESTSTEPEDAGVEDSTDQTDLPEGSGGEYYTDGDNLDDLINPEDE